jgi:NADPH:quinone reductase-like Zn-dependent oxidoreductase
LIIAGINNHRPDETRRPIPKYLALMPKLDRTGGTLNIITLSGELRYTAFGIALEGEQRMKVCRLLPPGSGSRLVFSEQARPRPAAGEVLVRMRAASLNRRDLMLVQGALGIPIAEQGIIPLSDGAGEVVEVGAEVSRFTVGDRVAPAFFQTWISGTLRTSDLPTTLGGPREGVLTEYRALPESGLVRIPSRLSFEEGATLPCAAVTAWNALLEGRALRLGETVLVMGVGGVSLFALQFALRAGARVIAIASTDEKVTRLLQLGASAGINFSAHPEWNGEVMRLTDGTGVDHILDIGGAKSLPQAMASVAIGGSINVIGMMTLGPVEFWPLIGKSATVRGIAVGSRTMFEAMNRAMYLNDIHPIIGVTMDWQQAEQAYACMEGNQHVGKIVLTF